MFIVSKIGGVMNRLNHQKTEILYQYFEKNGFDRTIDEISKGINVTKKTIFNRYTNRENMERMLQIYWRQRFRKNFLEKCQNCNNMVEVLLFIIYELKKSYIVENYFFEREMNTGGFFLHEDENSVISITKRIIKRGIDLDHFNSEIDITQYATFFIHNIIHLFVKKGGSEDIVSYILQPLLIESGKEIMNDVNLTHFFNLSLANSNVEIPKRYLNRR